MATSNTVSGGAGIQGIAELLNLLGGNKATQQTSSDTTALQGILGQLQGTNYSNVLQSIFTQAGGQIPGLTAGLSNSIGARTGGNSAVATVLGKLLESTAMKGADRVAQLQQGNQGLQIQAANAIAQGNRNTTTQQGTNLSRAGKVVGGLQLGSKLLDSKVGQQAAGKAKNWFDDLFNPADVMTTDGLSSAGLNMSFSDASGITNSFGGDTGGLFSDGFSSNNLFGDMFSGGGSYDATSDIDYGALFDGGGSEIADPTITDIPWWEFADGGLVGRDGKKSADSYPMGGKTKQPLPQAFADGGVVRAGGGRASSRVSYETDPVNANATLAAPTELLNQVGPGGELILPALQVPNISIPGESRGDPSGHGSGWDGNPASTPLAQMLAGFVGNYMLNSVVGPVGMAALNATSGITGFKPPQGPTGAAVSGILNWLKSSSSTTPYLTPAAAGATGDSVNGTPTGYTTGSGTSYTGESSSGSGGSNSDSDSSGATGGGRADGGHIKGPGTGISDSIPIKVSKGEYVVSADVVAQLGAGFFDALQEQYHTPAAVQKAGK